MATRIFDNWLNESPGNGHPDQRGVRIGAYFKSWSELKDAAHARSSSLKDGTTYVIDPVHGFESIIALMAVAMCRGASFIWSRPVTLPLQLTQLGTAIWTGFSLDSAVHGGRPLYGSATSGSSGAAKLPIGFADQLGITGNFYNQVMLRPWLPESADGGVIATCLGLDYSAPFMMCLLPALATGRDLLLSAPNQIAAIVEQSKREPVVAVMVPALLAAAAAAVPIPTETPELTILCTAGYLSSARIAQTRRTLNGVRFATSYGASEVGVMTLNREAAGQAHVGKPLPGKPVWIGEQAARPGLRVIRTAGPDCREFYALTNELLRNSDGAVSTCDSGHIDDAGNLYLDGRADSGQKHKGVLVYVKRIEQHLLGAPNVMDVRVELVVSETDGPDVLLAEVIGEVSEAQLREYCTLLDEPARPNRYRIVSEKDARYTARGKPQPIR